MRIAVQVDTKNEFANYGVPFEALREIKILQELRHPNVVKFVDVFMEHGDSILSADFFIVYQYALTDLETVILKARDKLSILPTSNIKRYMLMIMEGLNYLHSNWIFHRDISPGNILITVDGQVKITDFGFAKHFAGKESTRYTPDRVTLWYRPPEMLFGATVYTAAVDMWSAGCIFAEMLLTYPLFFGDNELEQLSKMFAALGTPTEESWPGMSQLPKYVPFTENPRPHMAAMIPTATPEECSLLDLLLVYDPHKRLSAKRALTHPYFSVAPEPTPCSELVLPESPEERLREALLSKNQNGMDVD
eukprot:TRINITY_DN4318_c0_g1_i1.p2 TRINITY_DN4318_c0_g1~~TRINITY_DN4318_c0_g1_i1.p2  ORF type:complete len:345 (+),score=59.81 TRINITY_DN4318_c0_g1_i1:120-1037(+)